MPTELFDDDPLKDNDDAVDEDEEKQHTDYTGLIIFFALSPVFVLITYLKDVDVALSACIVLGMIAVAIKFRWKRKHVWFWGTIVFVLALHIPLIFLLRVPQGSAPTLVYTMPIGIVDFFIIIVAVDTADRLFSKDSSEDGIQKLDL